MAIIPKGKHVKVTRNVLNVREGMTYTLAETWTGELTRDFDPEDRDCPIRVGLRYVPRYDDIKVEVMS